MLISSACGTFENFMSNNQPLIDLDDCFNYMNNIVSEEESIDDSFLTPITDKQLLEHFQGMFYEYKDEYTKPILKYIQSIPRNKVTRIYYKNNLYNFCNLPKMHKLIMKILNNCPEFKDPNKPPKSIQEDLEKLWLYMEEFVVYNYFSVNRINRLKFDVRKTVTTIDTDSNMLNLEPWVNYLDVFKKESETIASYDKQEFIFTSVNVMCYVLTKLIAKSMWKFTTMANVPEEIRPTINMKNEFLFSIQVLANVKKRYITNVLLQEGIFIKTSPDSIDIKGFDFKKSSCSLETKAYYEDIIYKYIVDTDEVNISGILRELRKFKDSIYASINNREKKYLTPCSVKETDAYTFPLRIQGYRAVMAWNTAFPDQEVQLPEKLDFVKVNMETEESIEGLRDTQPEVYERLIKGIFRNPDPEIRKKGINVFGIPRNISEIPEWLIPYIKTDKIVNDVLSKFYPVLHSLSFELYKTSDRMYHSNLIEF